MPLVMITYLEQLERQCADAGLDLATVCRAEGVADTTLARWRKSEVHCREATAKALFRRIKLMATHPDHGVGNADPTPTPATAE